MNCEVECLTLHRFGYLSFCPSFRVTYLFAVIGDYFDSVVIVAVEFFIVG